jgi:hypothetical protein
VLVFIFLLFIFVCVIFKEKKKQIFFASMVLRRYPSGIASRQILARKVLGLKRSL